MFPSARTVFHVDMDAFFVSVEELFDPSLKGKPVVVGGQQDERGVVAAASYAARKFGVHSAMPLRTAAKLCPQAIFVDGHPDRYRDCSQQVHAVLESFTPQVEMVSIDEAYLDMTGTERLHGPPLLAANKLHAKMKAETRLNCSIGIGTSRLVAKVCSGKAKPHGMLYAVPGQEAKFLAPLDVRDIPGVGKVTEQKLRELGILTVGDIARLDDGFLEEHLGKWGLALAGKARGQDAGAWFEGEIGEDTAAKSISHEHTYNRDTANLEQIEATLMRLSEMVGRRLREGGLHARTLQLKLRYKDFTTITRAHSLENPTQLDNEIFEIVRRLFRANWPKGAEVRLLGVHASSFTEPSAQGDLLDGNSRGKWEQALSAMDRLKDKFGESSITLGTAMKGGFRERTQENPAALPGKTKPKPSS
ncbi:MAG TPA: DNA polymerase IV [Terriglobales bacterium]